MTIPKVFASALAEENKGLRARIAELEAIVNPIVLDKNGTYWDRGFPNELIDHTIERCAQVVQQWINEVGASQHGRDLNTLLAAIRALKDKP